MIESNCLKFLTKLREILISGFQENSQKPDFRAKMAKFWTKKRSKNDQKFFYRNPNLLYLVLNHKIGLKNKNCQTNISRLEEIGQKWSKTSICHHKQCILTKNGQNGQNENFPRHNTTVKWLKAIVSSFWASYVKFWCAVLKKKLKNPIFWPKMAKNGEKQPKTAKREFFSKIRLEHFFRLIKIWLCAKNHQNLMRGCPDMVWRTHARTSVNP